MFLGKTEVFVVGQNKTEHVSMALSLRLKNSESFKYAKKKKNIPLYKPGIFSYKKSVD